MMYNSGVKLHRKSYTLHSTNCALDTNPPAWYKLRMTKVAYILQSKSSGLFYLRRVHGQPQWTDELALATRMTWENARIARLDLADVKHVCRICHLGVTV